jgi:pSer/pThr/pTyr-binding forkhead associated (FHA) protein
MDVRLVIEKGPTRTRELRVTGSDAFVGRQRGSGIRIPSAEVSRKHCRLRLMDGYVTVQDLGSSNGTFLNGIRIREEEVVRPGDHLQIGPITFVVEYEMTQAVIDRLAKMLKSETLEPLGEVEAMEVVAAVQSDEALEAVEVPDEDEFAVPLKIEEEAIAVEFDENEAAQWHLPDPNELRDIFAQAEAPPKPGKK